MWSVRLPKRTNCDLSGREARTDRSCVELCRDCENTGGKPVAYAVDCSGDGRRGSSLRRPGTGRYRDGRCSECITAAQLGFTRPACGIIGWPQRGQAGEDGSERPVTSRVFLSSAIRLIGTVCHRREGVVLEGPFLKKREGPSAPSQQAGSTFSMRAHCAMRKSFLSVRPLHADRDARGESAVRRVRSYR